MAARVHSQEHEDILWEEIASYTPKKNPSILNLRPVSCCVLMLTLTVVTYQNIK